VGQYGPALAPRHRLSMARRTGAHGRTPGEDAIARKLAALLLTLWKSREPYESFPTMA
jgi:hypothetical protein